MYASLVYSNLVRFPAGPDATGSGDHRILPDLAEKWEWSNPTTIVFTLRKGARFHRKPPVNGREVVAEDVKYSLERFRRARRTGTVSTRSSRSTWWIATRSGCVLREPFAPLLNHLANPANCAILPRELDEKFKDRGQLEAVIGTGPFVLRSYERGVRAVFERTANLAPSAIARHAASRAVPAGTGPARNPAGNRRPARGRWAGARLRPEVRRGLPGRGSRRRPGSTGCMTPPAALLYVGKAGDLRRRLAQYRTTRRTKKDRKRRALVGAAARIAWDVCASELEASLREIQLIQSLRPPANVAGAFPFLYPFIGIRADDREISFCLTTSPEAFPEFDLHGAFRSRDVTGEAFFALMRLLGIVGHPVSGRRRARVAHSYLFGFRRLPPDWPALWGRLLRGTLARTRWRISPCACSITPAPAPGAPRSRRICGRSGGSSTTRRASWPRPSPPPATRATPCRSSIAMRSSSSTAGAARSRFRRPGRSRGPRDSRRR